jgi:hypothetical protein
MLHVGETCCTCTRASECTPTHSLSSPPNHSTPPPPQNNTTHTNHNSNTSFRNRIPQSTFKTLTCRIPERQPSIRSKPQRMKRDLPQMLHVGETSRFCTRASECTPTHSLSSPPNHSTPPPPQNNTKQPPITTATQAPATASLNQRSKHSHVALQHVSLRSDQSLNA